MIDYKNLSLEQLLDLARVGDEKAQREIDEFNDWRRGKEKVYEIIKNWSFKDE